MAENEDQNEKPVRETPWPGGPRASEDPAPAPLYANEDAFADFAASETDKIDPAWDDKWTPPIAASSSERSDPNPEVRSGEALVERIPTSSQWPPAIDDPQLPPRAWQPDDQGAPHVPFIPQTYEPESIDENIRRSGLAWSAGIVFFCAVAFMLLLGWGFDLIFGSSPFGLVAGVVVGSAIGFIQFFRISSQIFQPSKRASEIKPFLSRDDDSDGGGQF